MPSPGGELGGVILNAAVGLSTDFTNFTDGLEQEALPLRYSHVTQRAKRQPLSTRFQSVDSVHSVDPTAFSRWMKGSAAWGHAAYSREEAMGSRL